MANKLDQLLNDSDFLSLPENEQNAFIDEMRQKDFGKIQPSENILQRAVNVGKNVVSQTVSQPQIDPNHPFLSAIGATTRFEGTPLGSYQAAHRAKSSIANEATGNPLLGAGLDIVSDPETWLGFGAAKKGVEELVNFGGKKVARGLAEEISSKVGKVQGEFNEIYKPIFKQKPVTELPSELKEDLMTTVIDEATGSPTPQVYTNLAEKMSVMTPEQLHHLKGKLYTLSERGLGVDSNALRNIRSKINQVLSNEEVYGKPYAEATEKYKVFSGEKDYIDPYVRDREYNPSESKILARRPLSSNEEEAFKAFGSRTGSQFVKKIRALKRGEKAKGLIGRAAKWGGIGAATAGGYNAYHFFKH